VNPRHYRWLVDCIQRGPIREQTIGLMNDPKFDAFARGMGATSRSNL
jgi:hypothetical protein